ncbi:hypothetical protein B0H14DRAFT_2583197 [Mycena olivaceomarginata]|nr:hypothetical protein B0H14DRAFT_2583197 [Mycena olivaceomarginata]
MIKGKTLASKAMFASMSGSTLTVPYADLTFAGRSIINHEFLDLVSSDNITVASGLIKCAYTHGISVVGYHSNSGGICMGGITCPAVIRSTQDASTFTAVFPTREWEHDESRVGTGPSQDFFATSVCVNYSSTVLDHEYLDSLDSILPK